MYMEFFLRLLTIKGGRNKNLSVGSINNSIKKKEIIMFTKLLKLIAAANIMIK